MVMFHQEYWSAQFMYDDPLGPFGTSDWVLRISQVTITCGPWNAWLYPPITIYLSITMYKNPFIQATKVEASNKLLYVYQPCIVCNSFFCLDDPNLRRFYSWDGLKPPTNQHGVKTETLRQSWSFVVPKVILKWLVITHGINRRFGVAIF